MTNSDEAVINKRILPETVKCELEVEKPVDKYSRVVKLFHKD